MNAFLKDLFLYFSAFVPMYFLIITRYILDIIFENIALNFFNTMVIILMLFLIAFGIVGLISNTVYCDSVEVIDIETVESKNITDKHFLGYFGIFILFALTFDLTHASMLCSFVLITIFVGIVYVNNRLFYINPLLNILGYNFYNVVYVRDGIRRDIKVFAKGSYIVPNQRLRIKINNDKFGFVSTR